MGFLISMMLLMTLLTVHVAADDMMTINQLIEDAKVLDGRQVTVKGEAIGEIMQRGENSWVNIKDSTNAIGIWMKQADAQKITYYGNYKYTGDSIIIVGVFHRACIEHGGEADIHCEKLLIEKSGYPVVVKISTAKTILAGSLLATMLIALFAVYYFMLRKKSAAL